MIAISSEATAPSIGTTKAVAPQLLAEASLFSGLLAEAKVSSLLKPHVETEADDVPLATISFTDAPQPVPGKAVPPSGSILPCVLPEAEIEGPKGSARDGMLRHTAIHTDEVETPQSEAGRLPGLTHSRTEDVGHFTPESDAPPGRMSEGMTVAQSLRTGGRLSESNATGKPEQIDIDRDPRTTTKTDPLASRTRPVEPMSDLTSEKPNGANIPAGIPLASANASLSGRAELARDRPQKAWINGGLPPFTGKLSKAERFGLAPAAPTASEGPIGKASSQDALTLRNAAPSAGTIQPPVVMMHGQPEGVLPPPVGTPAPVMSVQPIEARLEPRPVAALESAVEQLVEARETSRIARSEMTVRHGEFGAITMRLDASGTDMRATLTARDPGFVPAIQAALTERGVSAASDTAHSQTPRGQDQASGNASSQGGSAHAGHNSDGHYGSSPGSDQASPQPYFAQKEANDEGAEERDRASRRDTSHGDLGDAGLFA